MVFKSVYEFSSYVRYRLETNHAFRTTCLKLPSIGDNKRVIVIFSSSIEKCTRFTVFIYPNIVWPKTAARIGNAQRNVIVSFPIHTFFGEFVFIYYSYIRPCLCCVYEHHIQDIFTYSCHYYRPPRRGRGTGVARNRSCGSDEWGDEGKGGRQPSESPMAVTPTTGSSRPRWTARMTRGTRFGSFRRSKWKSAGPWSSARRTSDVRTLRTPWTWPCPSLSSPSCTAVRHLVPWRPEAFDRYLLLKVRFSWFYIFLSGLSSGFQLGWNIYFGSWDMEIEEKKLFLHKKNIFQYWENVQYVIIYLYYYYFKNIPLLLLYSFAFSLRHFLIYTACSLTFPNYLPVRFFFCLPLFRFSFIFISSISLTISLLFPLSTRTNHPNLFSFVLSVTSIASKPLLAHSLLILYPI